MVQHIATTVAVNSFQGSFLDDCYTPRIAVVGHVTARHLVALGTLLVDSKGDIVRGRTTTTITVAAELKDPLT